MKKRLSALVPVCITFGPLFMTGIVGTAPPQYTQRLLVVGCIMLVIGLEIMLRMIVRQQKEIEKIRGN